jgi:hypothetical protein
MVNERYVLKSIFFEAATVCDLVMTRPWIFVGSTVLDANNFWAHSNDYALYNSAGTKRLSEECEGVKIFVSLPVSDSRIDMRGLAIDPGQYKVGGVTGGANSNYHVIAPLNGKNRMVVYLELLID